MLEHPTTYTGIRSLLSLSNFFTRSVTSYARLVASLNKKLMRDHCKSFGPLDEKERFAVASVKDALINPPMLALPGNKGQTLLKPNLYTSKLDVTTFRNRKTEETAPVRSFCRVLNNKGQNRSTIPGSFWQLFEL